MREIKFRAQRVYTKEWVYGDLIHGVGFKACKMHILPQDFISFCGNPNFDFKYPPHNSKFHEVLGNIHDNPELLTTK